jgi:sugar lactone lactonase YvrE
MKSAANLLALVVSLGTLAGMASAQSVYTSPYTFTTLAGKAGVSGNADGQGAAATFSFSTYVAMDTAGNLYVSDSGNNEIRKVTPAGAVTTLAGSPGPSGLGGNVNGTGTAALFDNMSGIAVDKSGNVYVADHNNYLIRKISPAGVVTTFAGNTAEVLAGAGGMDGTGTAATFDDLQGLAVDSSGNLAIADGRANIRTATPAAVVSTLAGSLNHVAGSQDGLGANALFNYPGGVAVDGGGNIYVADTMNNQIRKVTPAGAVTTIAGNAGVAGSADGTGEAATFNAPTGIALDGSGNLFVADTNNNLIRMITPAGVVTTIAGKSGVYGSANGTGDGALFNDPYGVVLDSSGNLYVVDQGDFTVRKGSFAGAPQVQTQPTAQYVAVGGSASFSVVASGAAGLTYQWSFNGSAIPDATGSSYTITNAQSSNSGPYTVTVTNGYGSATSSPADLNVNTGPSGARLVNLSCRAGVGTGANVLIVGFVSGGSGTSGTQPVLVRGTGPALTPFGVTGVLPDPALTIYKGSNSMATNSGWGANAAQITAEDTALGAFALTSTSSKDSALYIPNLAPASYTAQVAGASADTGVALAEVYDATPPAAYSATAPRLVNLSARVQVGTGGNILIAGFVIGGTGSETVLVRASGPALIPFGVAGTLPDPKLQLINLAGATIASNNGWAGSSQISGAAASVGAFAWASATSNDSAILITLPPGAYTAQVSGASGDTGVALVEVYEVP